MIGTKNPIITDRDHLFVWAEHVPCHWGAVLGCDGGGGGVDQGVQAKLNSSWG